MSELDQPIIDYIASKRPGYCAEAVVVLMKRSAGLSADGACGLIQQWLDWKAEESHEPAK